MRRTAKRCLSIVSILAILAALVAPMRTSWACADGTQCVLDSSKQYVCLGSVCSASASCCLKKAVVCKHGAFPTADAEPSAAEIQAPDHCRFGVSIAPKIVGAVTTAPAIVAVAVALPALSGPEVPQPVSLPPWRSEYSLGYRPPPLRRAGPSRAPPTL